jgi:phosphoribosylglycinamide formyltransferase 2
MAEKVTHALTGEGIWGVEFFLADDGVYFSELSPRPHDTGMVTLANTQNFNEFELHLRAILGLPVPEVKLMKAGASAVILSETENTVPQYEGLEKATAYPDSDLRIFGKPLTRKYRRMGVALAYGETNQVVKKLVEKAKEIAGYVRVK